MPSIDKDKGHVIASAYDMGPTAHTSEKSLLPIIDEGIIMFDIHISAIGEVGFTCQTLRQIDSNIAIIFCSHMVTSLLMQPRGIPHCGLCNIQNSIYYGCERGPLIQTMRCIKAQI